MMRCFEDGALHEQLDQAAYKFKHKLMGHPALSLENLAQVLPALPKEKVVYSKNLLNYGDDFEGTFKQRPANSSLEDTIETLRVSSSYIMVSGPEVAPSFKPLHEQLISDVEALMRRKGVGNKVVAPQLYLFIASPNSITPFHIDRYSTYLMQFRGSKEVCVFPQWDERSVSAKHREEYVAYSNTHLPWTPEKDALAQKFEFSPGEAIHIPFIAGHHVRNGPDDVSISMSIIFNTQQSMAWRNALTFNHRARRLLSRVNMQPVSVGERPARDALKARLWQVAVQVKKAIGRD